MIIFEPKELVLPPVPLGYTSKGRVIIRNVRYDNVDLHCQLPADSALCPLKVNFPEGSSLTLNKQTVIVEVLFSARKSPSFSTRLVFYDGLANPYLLTVHTVADNDVFTNAGFLLSNWRINRTVQEHFDGIPQLKEDGSGIEVELLANSQAQAQGSAQQQVQAGSIPGVPQTSGVGSADKQAIGQKGTTSLSQQHHTQSMLNVNPLMQQMASPLTTTYSQLVSTQFEMPSYPHALLPIMLRFMNLTLLSQQQLIKWPESAIETFGMPLIEAIEHLLSQQIHGKVNPELIKSASTSVVIQSRDYVKDQFGLGDGTDRAKSGMGGYSESVSGLKGVTGGTQNNQGTPQK
ncbi:MAG: hypothetical protein EZS28_019695, partial [Streblomastix strix]